MGFQALTTVNITNTDTSRLSLALHSTQYTPHTRVSFTYLRIWLYTSYYLLLYYYSKIKLY